MNIVSNQRSKDPGISSSNAVGDMDDILPLLSRVKDTLLTTAPFSNTECNVKYQNNVERCKHYPTHILTPRQHIKEHRTRAYFIATKPPLLASVERDGDYELQPADTDVASRNVIEGSGLLGRQYILKDQTHTQREYSDEMKESFQKKHLTENHMALLRRFQEEYKQKNPSSSVDTFPSRNVSTLHNIGKTGEILHSKEIEI
ncbi:hypothetical protein CHS0354_009892 [Potamilus streckersoni]|uniref:Uncharacterized protein n=1 Tax=Potamilus streckersoni TaxID=2493646 RepID=A0AAE0VP32_9BIVA|nr:hypothetical protein CHS0354_009892 [Potamilus streckersoni]